MPKAMLDKLPEKAKDIYEAAWKKAKDDGRDDETAAKIAMGAVKRAGYAKDEDTGQWSKAQYHTIEMWITKAVKGRDGVMRWNATVSKFAVDNQGDEVTPEFFKYAARQVESGLRPAPVLCVSHIDKGRPGDEWTPGDVEALYVDGNQPKAKGTFRDTPLGRAAYKSVRKDWSDKTPDDQKVRISMGFFDEGSERLVTRMEDGTEKVGRRFLRGWIKHLALTRVPVVEETRIKAGLEEKSMPATTKKEDATSIVGDELAEQLLPGQAEKANLTDGMIVKGDDAEPEEQKAKKPEMEDEEPDEEMDGEDYEEEDEDEKEDKKAKSIATQSAPTPHDVAVAAFVDDFATKCKAVLLTDGDRTDKFKALQEHINTFGEGVVELVKGSTPPSSRDIADVVAEAVQAAVVPLQDQLAGVKAELDDLKQKATLSASGTPPAPKPVSLDTKARVVASEQTTPPDGIKKAKIKDLAWQSTRGY
jgi:cation transport regulator ChaB